MLLGLSKLHPTIGLAGTLSLFSFSQSILTLISLSDRCWSWSVRDFGVDGRGRGDPRDLLWPGLFIPFCFHLRRPCHCPLWRGLYPRLLPLYASYNPSPFSISLFQFLTEASAYDPVAFMCAASAGIAWIASIILWFQAPQLQSPTTKTWSTYIVTIKTTRHNTHHARPRSHSFHGAMPAKVIEMIPPELHDEILDPKPLDDLNSQGIARSTLTLTPL